MDIFVSSLMNPTNWKPTSTNQSASFFFHVYFLWLSHPFYKVGNALSTHLQLLLLSVNSMCNIHSSCSISTMSWSLIPSLCRAGKRITSKKNAIKCRNKVKLCPCWVAFLIPYISQFTANCKFKGQLSYSRFSIHFIFILFYYSLQLLSSVPNQFSL